MRYLITLLAIALFPRVATAGSNDYNIDNIPKPLFDNADAIKRNETITFEIINPGEAIYKCHYAITVLNERGDKMVPFELNYDKSRLIKNLEGYLYNSKGERIKKVKKNDFKDRSDINDISIMDDNRIKLHNFYYKDYPYTVEYNYTLIFKHNLLAFPKWNPVDYQNLSVQQSSFEMLTSKDYIFHYKAFNYPGKPVITNDGNEISSKWEIKDRHAIPKEDYLPDSRYYKTIVYVAPSDFEMQEYTGNMDSWNNFGEFINKINEGRQDLPENVKSEVHRIADSLKTTFDKVAALYHYLQQNTRYISIQLGIGGWQPFDAQYVASKSYGDCKALCNYMLSLLKEEGIKANYTLIYAGDNAGDIIPDFPSAQFNHIIIAVPDNKDTIWLECTSQTLPPGYLSGFTADRHALMVTENGAVLVKTPTYSAENNVRSRKIKATVDKNNVEINADNLYSGRQQDYLHQIINLYPRDKIKSNYLLENIDLSGYDINDFNYTQLKTAPGKMPVIEETLNITAPNYANISGKRLFINPNILSKSNFILKKTGDRSIDIDIRYSYTNMDSVEIFIPSGYQIEYLPAPTALETEFGKYTSSVKLEDNRIIYHRYFKQNKGIFVSGKYHDMEHFYDTIYKYDHDKVVLVHAETQ